MNASSYMFTKTPFPIVLTDKLSRLEKDVWMVVFTLRSLNKRRGPSVSQVAKFSTNGDRANARRAIDRMAKRELLEVRRRRVDGMHVVEIRELWPDWLNEDVEAYLLKEARNDPGSSQPRGDGSSGPGGMGSDNPPYKTIKREGKDDLADECSSAVHEGTSSPAPDERGEEELETDYDGGSRSAGAVIDAEAEKKKAARKKEGGKKVRPPSGPELKDSPSKRWEFRRFDSKAVPSWGGQDLIGYWVCKHAALRGKEDEDFCVGEVSCKYVRRTARNVATFVRKYLDGDWRIARDAVDCILERAEERGRPVSLSYYFTPKKDEALREILEKTGGRRKPREKTLLEKNDAAGSDKEHWKRATREWGEREKARLAAEEVGRDG